MKIIDVRAYAVEMPFVKVDLPISIRNSRTLVFVKISTDEGISGNGEAAGFFNGALPTARAIESMLKPIILGKNPLQIQKLWEEMYRAVYYAGGKGVTISAISGVEIALWDIAGKVMNVPVYRLLGGRCHDTLRAYASLMRYTKTEDVTLACNAMIERGYTAIKLHQIDVPSVAAARRAIGNHIPLMLDVNCAWDIRGAIDMGRQLEPFNLLWYEEPIWPADDYDGLARVQAEVRIPIAVGENEYTARGFANLVTRRVVDVLQPTVLKVGGILQEKKVFTLAESFGLKVAPQCISYGPAMAATLHVCCSEPGSEFIETGVDTPEANILTEPLTPEKGWWKVPEKPGLGVELDESVLSRYAIK